MHELAITENILNIALSEAKRNNASRVTEIRIVMGELSTFVPECVQEYFNLLSEDTEAYKAKLSFTTIPACACCNDCGTSFHIKNFYPKCPECNSLKVKITSGREFYVDSLDIETDD